MRYFIIVFDTTTDTLTSVTEYADARRAQADHAAMEREKIDDLGTKVLLLSADSLETLKETHSNFFSARTLRDVLEESSAAK